MPVPVARLVATVPTPLDAADAPEVLHGLLVQRGDADLVARDLVSGAETRFPAPWPRGFGTATVAPRAEFAVFAGLHAVRAVNRSGGVRWEVPHACWGGCDKPHASADEYVTDDDHALADHGSAAVSADGKLVWAHVFEHEDEAWVVLDAADGRVLGRAETGTTASGSFHTPHPDPARMFLSIGEGEEGSPVLSGRWDGRLVTSKVDDELILLDVSPSGQLLTVDVTQETLAVHDDAGDAVGRGLDATGNLPESTDGGRVYWDLQAVFISDDMVIAADAARRPPRHWLVRDLTLREAVTYPVEISGPPAPAGDGTWFTLSEDGRSVHFWTL